MAFIPRFLTLGRDHFFLLGPRGTGKTLWCANQFPNALRVDLLDPATLRQLMAQPERLRELVDANIQKKHIVIDEIQKLPVAKRIRTPDPRRISAGSQT
jgi:predicted AAA+ superfamily ATPase